MGERTDRSGDGPEGRSLGSLLREERSALDGLAELLPGSVYSAVAVAAAQPGHPTRTGTPLIIDTDLGGDADDAIALVAAALSVPELALVSTVDETGASADRVDDSETAAPPFGQRARAARWLLDAAGRPEVPVTAGTALPGAEDRFVLHVGDLENRRGIPPHGEGAREGADVVAAMRSLAKRHPEGMLRWVGIGPFSNLAQLVTEAPEIASRLLVTQMGAAINYRHPDRAEHNVRMDIPAAHTVFNAAARGGFADLELVISDVTFTADLQIADGDHRHRTIDALAQRCDWAEPVALALQRWFSHPHGHPSTLQHDALTLTAALELPFIRSTPARVELDDVGRMRRTESDSAARARIAHSADYAGFWHWLDQTLGLTNATTDGGDRSGDSPSSVQAAGDRCAPADAPGPGDSPSPGRADPRQ